MFGLLLLMLLVSCGNDETDVSDIPVVSQNPTFKIKKEKVYFGEYHTYSDVLKPFYYQFAVEQLNPNAVFPQEKLKEMEDSINNIIELSSYKDFFYLMNVGIEINEKPLDMVLQLLVLNEAQRDKYVALGRTGLIDIWKKNRIHSFFTTFEDQQDLFSIEMRTEAGVDSDGLWLSFRLDKHFQNDYVKVSDYFLLNDGKPTSEPSINTTEYYWTYDRFNDRVYWDDEGNVYTTKIVVKRLEEIEGYDDSIKVPIENWWSSFKVEEKYPVIQIYKEDELWFEGKIYKYTEEHNECEGGVNTILGFGAHTKKNGYYWELKYDWVGYSRIQLRKLDFTKPTQNDDFTEIETINVMIIKDEKDGHKGTGSFDNGKGRTFSFNTAY